ncbi:MAG: histidine kinase [Microbacterium sp.]
MTTDTALCAPRVSRLTPGRVGLQILHLIAVGIGGIIIFASLFSLLASGVTLLFAIGFGLLVLVGFVYCLYATGWLETARVEGLHGFGLEPLAPVRRVKPGFAGWITSLLRQTIDPRMWRAIASLAATTALGWVAFFFIGVFVDSLDVLFSPLYTEDGGRWLLGIHISSSWGILWGIGGVVVSLVGLIALAALTWIVTRAIMVPSREAQLAAAARASAEQARASSQQREGAVRAADVERTRIERDLHDGVQPRLVSVGMTLGLAKQKLDTDPDAARELIDEAHTSTKAAITELRQLARGIHASVLDDRGLDAALSALAGRSHIPVQLDVRMDGRCSRDTEAAVYFAIAESLTNAAKHSRASQARVTVRKRVEDNTLWARVEDNGIGGAVVTPGGGLDGISSRVLSAGGTVRLESPAGGPTALEVSVPCAS